MEAARATIIEIEIDCTPPFAASRCLHRLCQLDATINKKNFMRLSVNCAVFAYQFCDKTQLDKNIFLSL